MAAVDFFLKIDGIEGESQDHKHKGEIQLAGFTHGSENDGKTVMGGGLGAGKVTMHDAEFTASVGKHSPKLKLACAQGDHIKHAVLTARKAGKEQQEFFKITFSDVLVSLYEISGGKSDDHLPTEKFSLNFAKIETEYKEQKADGSLGGAVKVGWNLKQNKKV